MGNADSATNFTQMEPQTGAAASEKTVAYLGLLQRQIIPCF